MSREVYYFGVWPGSGAGHYLRASGGARPGFSLDGPDNPLPWRYELDSQLCPMGDRDLRWKADYDSVNHQGEAKITRKDGWTVLAFWDSSEDKRGDCNSNFILKTDEDLEFDELVKIFREEFPELWARFDKNFGVRLA